MDIDVRIGNESLSFNIENPFRFDVSSIAQDIVDFGNRFGVDLAPFEIERLIPRMIRGVAGCEAGCPSDAKSVVREGFRDFSIEYIEGGILSATKSLGKGKPLQVKVFPDF
jgi:hypothetical protein